MKRLVNLGVIFTMLGLVSACASMRTPDGEQIPLFHPDYRSESKEELRRETNYKNITTGKTSDNRMPDYHIFDDEEENAVWGSAYTK